MEILSSATHGIDCIIKPRESDILSGRGGLSNNHPGNDLYRQLIRSTRPLYKACPKFTKLYISKAIVEVIQDEGGRFLVRSPNDSAVWSILSYEKAVQKTSQGLREKEGNSDDDQKTSLPNVPQMLLQRGENNNPPALKDFVRVTFHRVRAMQEAKKTIVPQCFLQQEQRGNDNTSDWNCYFKPTIDRGLYLPTMATSASTTAPLFRDKEVCNSFVACRRSIGNEGYWMNELHLEKLDRIRPEQEKKSFQLRQQQEFVRKNGAMEFDETKKTCASTHDKMVTSDIAVLLRPGRFLQEKVPDTTFHGGLERLSAMTPSPKLLPKRNNISACSTADNKRRWINEHLLLQKTISLLQQRQLRNLSLMNNPLLSRSNAPLQSPLSSFTPKKTTTILPVGMSLPTKDDDTA